MTMTLPVPLPARVLLLGSGELGKEVVIALQRYGCTVIACDSYGNAPAMQVADESRVFDMSDPQALREVLDSVDVDLIVPEVEAIATDELSAYEERGVRVVPNAFAVQATMDRQRIRNLARRAHIGLPLRAQRGRAGRGSRRGWLPRLRQAHDVFFRARPVPRDRTRAGRLRLGTRRG